MKLISQVKNMTGAKLTVVVASALLVSGIATAATLGVNVNPVQTASQTQPQSTVETPAATPVPAVVNSTTDTQTAATASQDGSDAAQVGTQVTAQVAPKPQMGKCRETNGDGSIKYDANEQPITYDCPVSPAATPAPTPTPEVTPVPDNSGTTVSNPNH